nr:SIS domain-containing protein [Chromobacterium sp. ASV5]
MILGHDSEKLERAGGLATAREIAQQPAAWEATLDIVHAERPRIDAFLSPLLAQADLRIVLTGAGTSAFAGEALAPYLSRRLGRAVEAIATTDIVTSPASCFSADRPTLLISFARSGNSPESLAAVELASQLRPDCRHLVLTCNAEGELRRRGDDPARALTLLMPPQTNDRSFAMTSSLSSMMLACLAALLPGDFNPSACAPMLQRCHHLLDILPQQLKALADNPPERIVYLGSNELKGIAREGALKMLELTAGRVVALFDSATGFRHGPKSVVNSQTLVVQLISNQPHTRRYELDLLAELRRDDLAERIVALADRPDPAIDAGERLYLPPGAEGDDMALAFCYLPYLQTLALEASLRLGISPDNPCPGGQVNRVVQGVTIYPYAEV